MTITPTAYVNPYEGDDDYTTPITQADSGAYIIVNGNAVSVGNVQDTKEEGRTTTKVTIDERKLENEMVKEEDKKVVTIFDKKGSDAFIAELNGQIIKDMKNKQAIIELKTGIATYTSPAQQINIDAISEQFGTEVQLKDIKVTIEIAKLSLEGMKTIENLAKAGQFTIIAPPVEFNVTFLYQGKTIGLDSFSAYVERTIEIPEWVVKANIKTGIIMDSDGTVRHVPTQIILIDGKYYAKINSLTNSTYLVVSNPVSFTDVGNHWAKEAINDMGSRMIIGGSGNGLFFMKERSSPYLQ